MNYNQQAGPSRSSKGEYNDSQQAGPSRRPPTNEQNRAPTNENQQPGPSRPPTNERNPTSTIRRNYKAPKQLEKPIAFAIPVQSVSSSPHLPEEPTSVLLTVDNNCPYPGWKLFFPKEKYADSSNITQKINIIEEHFKRSPSLYDLPRIKKRCWFSINLQSLNEDTNFLYNWANFEQEIKDTPEDVLSIMSLAMHKLVSEIPPPIAINLVPEILQNLPVIDLSDTQEELPVSEILQDSQMIDLSQEELPVSNIQDLSHTYICNTQDLPVSNIQDLSQYPSNNNTGLQIIRPRIQGYVPIVNLRNIKIGLLKKLTCVQGTVIKVSVSELLCTWMTFSCSICSTEQTVRQPDGIMTPPTSCKGVSCRARSKFCPLLLSPYTRTESYQIIRLQESNLGEQLNSGRGRVPSSMEVELTGELVDSVCPGDNITLTGIVQVRQQEECQRKATANFYKIYIRAIYVSSNQSSNRNYDFTHKEVMIIKAISEEPCPFRLLVNSLCPTVYGHDLVKAGLVLGLFGGSNDQETTGKRSDIHVLVAGDPGVGKSQILKSCANVAPRGIFVSGKNSTAAVPNKTKTLGGGCSLEAGALVLADQGCCCIDEIDKMSTNQKVVLEVMEQQTVSVAKAGILCSLPARTTILACANPSVGHYDRSKTVAENLKIIPPLLSRFDLIFIVLDKADEHLDSLLTDDIQALDSDNMQHEHSNTFVGTSRNANIPQPNRNKTLHEHLRIGQNENLELLPHSLMQKYIVFTKSNCHPKLTDEAGEELKNYYLKLRKVRTGPDTIPVTIRQLIRLTQARARAELSLEATRKHALDVLEIVRHSMLDVFSPDVQMMDMNRGGGGPKMSKATQEKKFLALLKRKSLDLNLKIFDIEELKGFATPDLTENIIEIIDSLNFKGFLIKQGRTVYKFIAD